MPLAVVSAAPHDHLCYPKMDSVLGLVFEDLRSDPDVLPRVYYPDGVGWFQWTQSEICDQPSGQVTGDSASHLLAHVLLAMIEGSVMRTTAATAPSTARRPRLLFAVRAGGAELRPRTM